MTTSKEPAIRLEDTLKAVFPDGKFSGPLPPVEKWNPPHCGDIGMEIRTDGSWWHEGTRITRERLVKLFSRILRKDEDGITYLVTPYEKVIVHVADAPFRAVRVDVTGAPGRTQTLVFVTNLGDVTEAGPERPIRVAFDGVTGEPSPYVRVRGRLDAKLTRPVYYELANMTVPDPNGSGDLGVWSGGQFFRLGPAA